MIYRRRPAAGPRGDKTRRLPAAGPWHPMARWNVVVDVLVPSGLNIRQPSAGHPSALTTAGLIKGASSTYHWPMRVRHKYTAALGGPPFGTYGSAVDATGGIDGLVAPEVAIVKSEMCHFISFLVTFGTHPESFFHPPARKNRSPSQRSNARFNAPCACSMIPDVGRIDR